MKIQKIFILNLLIIFSIKSEFQEIVTPDYKASGNIAEFQLFYDPVLVVVLMVKNEAKVIEDTLQPYIDGGIKHFFIFDTGSTDNTVEVTQECFKKNNIEIKLRYKDEKVVYRTSNGHV